MNFLTMNWPLHHPPDLNVLKSIAFGYEDRIYAEAISKDDYVTRVEHELHVVVNTYRGRFAESPALQNPCVAAKSPTDSGLLDSAAGLTSPVDWREEMFKKIKFMKDSYLPELVELNRKVTLMIQQKRADKPAKCLEEYVLLGNFIKSMMKFLQTSKADVRFDWKDDLADYETKIRSVLASNGRTPAQLQPVPTTAVELPAVPQVQNANTLTPQDGSVTAQTMKRAIYCEMGSSSKRQKRVVEALASSALGNTAGDTGEMRNGHPQAVVLQTGQIETLASRALGNTAGDTGEGRNSNPQAMYLQRGEVETLASRALGDTGEARNRRLQAILRQRRENSNGMLQNSNDILEEMVMVNERLFHTVVRITGQAVSTSTSSGVGTMIKFFFKIPLLRPNTRSPFTLSGVAPLTLLVPSNYPMGSPIIVDNPQVYGSSCSEESEIVGVRAWPMLIQSMRSLVRPVTVGGLARLWDNCAHRVIAERCRGRVSFASVN